MKNTEKFTNKAENYAKYRPTYPAEMIGYLHSSIGINKTSIVGDIGAGTGLLTKLLSAFSGKVIAVEPNESMRNACISYCEGIGNIKVWCGSAEETALPDASVDAITVAQAFHWFDKEKAAAEFKRIIKPDGAVVLIWNRKEQDNGAVIENIEICKQYCPNYVGLSGGFNYEDDSSFNIFRNGEYERRIFRNDIVVTLDEYIGGCLSASYAPDAGDANYSKYVESLKRLFEKHSVQGKLVIPNNTHSYAGCL